TWLRYWSKPHGASPNIQALICDGRPMTYGELDLAVNCGRYLSRSLRGRNNPSFLATICVPPVNIPPAGCSRAQQLPLGREGMARDGSLYQGKHASRSQGSRNHGCRVARITGVIALPP